MPRLPLSTFVGAFNPANRCQQALTHVLINVPAIEAATARGFAIASR